ncbi:MAG: hypothetical protein WCX91_02220 [Candidatus Omnitrophota bacterium]|jgi:hypothetical protein
MKTKVSIFVLILVCAVAGCSSKVVVRDISGPAVPVGENIDGVPMQFADRQQLTVFTKQPDGSYKEVHSLVYAMPDQSRLFAVSVDSDVLSNNTLTLAFYDDGTPKTVGLTTTSQGQTAFTQLGTSAAAIATSAATFDQQRLAAEQKVLQQKQEMQKIQQAGLIDRETKSLAYRKALETVIVEQAKIDNLLPETKPEVRVAEESNLRVLKLTANQAARALGEQPPYPDADILP